jgi:ATP-binding cassette subfamily B protein
VLKIVWDSGPAVVVFGLVARLVASLLPLALLWIPKWILEGILHARATHQPVSPRFWWLVGAEFSVALLTSIMARAIDYSDSLLADKYTRYVSIQVMRHSAELDLIAYEDPAFYDRLERARVQATDRLGMIQAIGRLIQLVITTATLSAAIIGHSPWLMLLLVGGVLPAFLGESHFAFLGYAKNFRQTPARRQLDYLRLVGGSKEAAKELKLFGLSGFLTKRFTRLSDEIYEENVKLSRRKLIAGGFLSTIATLGLYSAYLIVI